MMPDALLLWFPTDVLTRRIDSRELDGAGGECRTPNYGDGWGWGWCGVADAGRPAEAPKTPSTSHPVDSHSKVECRPTGAVC